MADDDSLPLLNVFEVAGEDGRMRHLLAFIEPVRAGSSGIDPRSIVGEITSTGTGGYDPNSLLLNPGFVEAFTTYMNEVAALAPEIVEPAKSLASGWVYVIDPRNANEPGVDPPTQDLVGAYAVDEAGQVVPRSFQYNKNHVLIDQERGMSGIFIDRLFYDWLHPHQA